MDRFTYKDKRDAKLATEDEIRINELCRDLEEHTGVTNEKHKDIIASQKRIRKHPYRILKEERDALTSQILNDQSYKMQELRDFIGKMETTNFAESLDSKVVNSSTMSSRRASQ